MRIPAGVDDGQRIRLKGRGGPGRNGGPPGDLYVVVRVVAAPAVPAVAGATSPWPCRSRSPRPPSAPTSPCPTLDGDPVTLRIPAGTRSGRTFRVKGKGVADAKGTGDLLVTVEVAVPSKLSSAERKAVEAFRAASDGASPAAHLGV